MNDRACCEQCGNELGQMAAILTDLPLLLLCFDCVAKAMHGSVVWPGLATEVIQ